jgi:hypothetical protein
VESVTLADDTIRKIPDFRSMLMRPCFDRIAWSRIIYASIWEISSQWSILFRQALGTFEYPEHGFAGSGIGMTTWLASAK